MALLLENRPEFILHWLALNAIGASVAPLNGDMRPEELQHRLVTSGSSGKPKRQFESRCNMRIVEGWAMTETGGAAVTDTAALKCPAQSRCVGMPRDVMDWRLVDAAGRTVPTGEEDALLVRAKGRAPRNGFFSGYLGDAVATEQAWDGSWFQTGDILSADENGLLYFLDRKKSGPSGARAKIFPRWRSTRLSVRTLVWRMPQ